MIATGLAGLTLLLHAVLMAGVAPALPGVLRGVPLAHWRVLVRMARKPAMVPPNASFLFPAAPPLALGAAMAAALLVPSFALGMATAGGADLVVIVGLLAASRIAPALAAHDAGAAMAHGGAGLAAARLSSEPVLLLAILATALLAGTTNLDAMALRDSFHLSNVVAGVLAGLALLAAVVEPPGPAVYSGRHLALVTAAAQLRRLVGLSVVATVALPFGLAGPGAGPDAWVVGMACWLLKLGVLAGLAGLVRRHRTVLQAAAVLASIAATILATQWRA